MHGELRPQKKRQPIYRRSVRVSVEALWEIFDQPCGQRLKPMVDEELDRLRALGEVDVDDRMAQNFERVYSATIDRLHSSRKME